MAGASLFSAIYFFVFVIHAGLALKTVNVESSGQIGSLIAITTLGAPLGAAVFYLVSRKLSIGGVLAVILLLRGLGTAAIGLSASKLTLVAAGIFQQLARGMMVPTLIFWAGIRFEQEHRGRGLGSLNASVFLGQFLCAPIMQLGVIVTGGVMPTFVALGGVAIVGAGVTAVLLAGKPASNSVKERTAALRPCRQNYCQLPRSSSRATPAAGLPL